MNFMTPTLYVPPRASTRKRSLPTGPDAARLSFVSRRSESDRELLGLVPLGVVFMEQVALNLSVSKEHTDVRYVLRAQHLKSNATWSHARTFDDYRRFQQRLLKALNHGHFCSAECPWLFTFLKSYFPKKHLFHFATSRVVASRKDALQRFFTSLQNFLLNRANHNCSVVANAVVNEVVDFVYGDYAKYYQVGDASGSDNQRSSFCVKSRASADGGISPEDDDASTASGSSSCMQSLYCSLCESSLEGEAYASTRRTLSTTFGLSFVEADSPVDLSSAVSSSAPASCSALSSSCSQSSLAGRRSTYYVTTLGCGHQFHDECIVPKLNETLRCPTCDHLEVK